MQIPFDTHRYLFRNYHNSFTSEDAIQSLESIRYTQSVRVPDPSDPQKMVTTRTTTTFNMARDMAKALCQQFLWARLMECAVDTQTRSFRDRNIWQLTPKGLHIVEEFCVSSGVDTSAMAKYFGNIKQIRPLRISRTIDDDQIVLGRAAVANIFRVMIRTLPLNVEQPKQWQINNNNGGSSSTSTSTSSGNEKHSRSESIASSLSSSSSVSGHKAGSTVAGSEASSSVTSLMSIFSDAPLQLFDNRLISSLNGMKAGKQSKTSQRMTFTTQLCCDWLTEICTVANRDESEEIATEFVKHGWLEYLDSKQSTTAVNACKTIYLVLTEKGQKMLSEQADEQARYEEEEDRSPVLRRQRMQSTCTQHSFSGESSRPPSTAMDHAAVPPPTPVSPTADLKEGNSGRLKLILDDPQLRSLFKDFLRANFCEENLDFYIDYANLRRKCRNQSPAMPSQNQKDLLEDAHAIWATYLAPGAPSELNVEHALRQEMARLVSSMVSYAPPAPGHARKTVIISTHSTSQSLRMMLKWFDRVDEHTCRLMASDSVPKFVKTQKYRKLMARREKHEIRRDSGAPTSSDKDEQLCFSLNARVPVA